jgi:hypothetical protein
VWLWRGLGAAVVLALAAAVWIAWTGLRARDELTSARSDITRLRAALVAGDQATADQVLADAQTHAANARDLTTDPVWRMAGWVPVLGRTPAAISQATSVVDEAAASVLPPLVDAADRLAPGQVMHGDSLDLSEVASALPSVQRARLALDPLTSQLDEIRLGGVPGPVASGVTSLNRQMNGLANDLTAVATAAAIIPPMLGQAGDRHYLVVFQNDAEARGTGGLVGAYAVVQASGGRLSVTGLGTDADLASATSPVLDLGPAYRQLFGADPALWANTNLSANFPSAARQQLELWRRQHGQKLDGVIAVDPVVLSYLLAVTGPARLPDGTQITAASIAPLTMQVAYARYPTPAQNPQRKAFLQTVAAAALGKVLAGGNPQRLLAALGTGAAERRLLVYSAHPAEEALIADTAVSGVVDDSPGPYAGVAIDNASGSKVDYYTTAGLSYVRGCAQGGAGSVAATVTVTLTDKAPARGLPQYVGYRLDRGPITSAAGRGGDGSVLDRVLVYLATGAQVVGATLDGQQVPVTPGRDGAGAGRPVAAVPVELAAGQTRVLRLQVIEPVPTVQVRARAWVSPLATTPTATVTASTCR